MKLFSEALGPELGALIAILIVILVVALRVYALTRKNGRRARCPKCGIVFEMFFVPGLHIGPLRYAACPACGKRSLMRPGIEDPVSWPKEEGESGEKPKEADDIGQRIRNSKYE